MDIPNQISPEELQLLSEQATSKGLQPLESKDLVKLAKEKVKELEEILEEMNSCNTVGIIHERWQFFLKARTSLKLTIRCLKRSIAI